jgi:hypothetical protein
MAYNKDALRKILEVEIKRWPDGFVAKGRGYHSRALVGALVIRGILSDLNISYETVTLGGGPRRKGRSVVVVPLGVWLAVQNQCKKQNVDCPAAQLDEVKNV